MSRMRLKIGVFLRRNLEMKISATILLAAGLMLDAQSLPPNMPQLPPGMTMPPGMNMPAGGRRAGKRPDSSRANPPGVPITIDSAPMKSFQLLEQHPVYHMRMTIVTPDPQMAQMMASFGIGDMETIVAGGVKQVSMKLKMPMLDTGKTDDFEFKSVSKDGRAATIIISTAAERIKKAADASIAKAIADMQKATARTVAQSLAQGPVGWARAGFAAAEDAVFVAEITKVRQKVHDFFEWKCVNGVKQQPVDRTKLPPMTDLKETGDQTLDGTSVAAYEFYVKEKDQFHGPMHMYVAKESGLPMRIEMSDPQMRGASMKMDYFDFDKGGEIEVPGCLANGN